MQIFSTLDNTDFIWGEFLAHIPVILEWQDHSECFLHGRPLKYVSWGGVCVNSRLFLIPKVWVIEGEVSPRNYLASNTWEGIWTQLWLLHKDKSRCFKIALLAWDALCFQKVEWLFFPQNYLTLIHNESLSNKQKFSMLIRLLIIQYTANLGITRVMARVIK